MASTSQIADQLPNVVVSPSLIKDSYQFITQIYITKWFKKKAADGETLSEKNIGTELTLSATRESVPQLPKLLEEYIRKTCYGKVFTEQGNGDWQWTEPPDEECFNQVCVDFHNTKLELKGKCSCLAFSLVFDCKDTQWTGEVIERRCERDGDEIGLNEVETVMKDWLQEQEDKAIYRESFA